MLTDALTAALRRKIRSSLAVRKMRILILNTVVVLCSFACLAAKLGINHLVMFLLLLDHVYVYGLVIYVCHLAETVIDKCDWVDVGVGMGVSTQLSQDKHGFNRDCLIQKYHVFNTSVEVKFKLLRCDVFCPISTRVFVLRPHHSYM